MIDPDHETLSIRRQCELLGLNRSTLYYEPKPASDEDLVLMRRIDRQYLKTPFYGSRRMTLWLRNEGLQVNRKRIQRLMRVMGLEAIYPKKTTIPSLGHKIFPYLLRGVTIERPDQVWSADITYVGLQHGFLYLVAILDWFSRRVLSWRVSNTMDVEFCLEALDEAFERFQAPEIFNSDQGSQFTSVAFTGRVLDAGASISMDGRGRWLDNVFVERLWRTVKYENIFLKNYETGADLVRGLAEYFEFYNTERQHQALDYRTPKQVHESGLAV
jgi:putative transposase